MTEHSLSGVAKRLGLITLLAGILVALLGLLAPPASASSLLHPETRVAAIAEPNGQLVGPHADVLAVQGRERAPNYDSSATGSSVAAEGGADLGTITGPGGIELPGVPDGATGVPTDTGKGLTYQIPEGTAGLNSRVTSIRVMDPVTTGPYQYENGYVSYMNQSGQTVNPLTGQTVSPSDPWAHIPLPPR